MFCIDKYLNQIFIQSIQKFLESHNFNQSHIMTLWKELDITVSARSDYQYNGLIRFFQVLKQQTYTESATELNFDDIISN